MKNLGSLHKREDPRSVTTSLKVWPGLVATPEREDAKNFQQFKRRRMDCSERW